MIPAPDRDASRDIVQFRNVSVRFSEETVLNGVDLSVGRGEFVCLLGPSGCGKSTTLRILGHLLREYSGDVSIDGLPPAQAWERLAYVFQSPRLVPWRTALGNVLLGMELRFGRSELSKDERLRRATDGLAMVGLEHDMGKYTAMLSGGERQRVAIARALAVDPEIILMDEPLAALDVNTRQRLREEILRIWQETGKTIIFVTHDLDEALHLADRIYLFSNKPTRILDTYKIVRPRPRAVDSDPELLDIRRRLRALFGNSATADEMLGVST